jgi:quercetin dioxygenase-like cupin family protein
MENSYKFIADLAAQLPDLPDETIVSRSLQKNELTDVTLFGFAAGQELSEHTSAWPAILHFIQGEGQLMLGEDSFDYQPGSWAYMPARLPHAIQAQTQTIMLLTLLRAA